MNSSVINIKTNPETKTKAKKVAEELGFSLSSLINAYLKQLIKTKSISFSVSDELPTEYLLSILKESKDDIASGNVSPLFDNPDDAITWLNRSTSNES